VEVAPRETAATVPRPDPEAERRAAREVLTPGVSRVVAALAGGRLEELAELYTGVNAAWRNRFLAHVRDFRPAASLGQLDPPVLTESGAEAAFTVSFQWRGNFGVERRGQARFAASARRVPGGWEFTGVRLLQAFP
jgi:hypothetical protein